jgi:DNA-binding MarR family transcriptional regulator
MNSRQLAEKYLEQLADTDQIKMARQFNKMVQGDSFVLNYLYTHDCQAYPSEICNAMAVTSARIAKILADMKAKGLITRVSSSLDARHIMVVLTTKGIECVKKNREDAVSRLEQTFSILDEQDIEDLIRIKDKLTRAMNEKNVLV